MSETQIAQELESRTFEHLRVADVMERGVQFAHRQTKGDVLASMVIEGFGGVPIVDEEHRVVGIVTEFDLLAALDSGRRLSDVCAQDVMMPEPLRVTMHTDLRTLMHVLQVNHFIRVPVLDREGKLIGIVARRDVLRGYVSSKAA